MALDLPRGARSGGGRAARAARRVGAVGETGPRLAGATRRLGMARGGPLQVLVGAHRQVAQDLVVLAHAVLDRGQRVLAALALDAQQDVLALVQLGDRIGQLAPGPALLLRDLGAARGELL